MGPESLQEVKGLWKFQVNRMESNLWAQICMQFLVYDDTDEKANGYDSDDDEGMLELAMKMSMAAGEEEEGTPGDNYGEGSSRQADVTLPPVSRTDEAGEDEDERMLPLGVEASPKDADSAEGTPACSPKGVDGGSLQGIVLGEIVDLLKFIAKGKLAKSPEEEMDASSGDSPAEPRRLDHCQICIQVPEFPSNRKTRKFRLITLPREAQPCRHYVAVSYCWPQRVPAAEGRTDNTGHQRTCRIRDLDGTTRGARALDDVLDRAVDFANTCGLRMIWIDQECLPQPDAMEGATDLDRDLQQLGVQAMDIVYHRAIITAGLHDGPVIGQEQYDTINELVAFDEVSSSASSAQQFAVYVIQFMARVHGLDWHMHAMGFLDAVRRDRWYTRAWVVQEAISSSDGLVLVFRKYPGVVGASKFRHPEGRSPPHSLDHQKPTMPSEVVGIPVKDLRSVVRAVKSLFEFVQRRTLYGQMVLRDQTEILEAAEALHPADSIRRHPFDMIQTSAVGNYGNQQAVSAATALTLLRTRDCYYAHDRIAIVANMCCYELRIDTAEAAARCGSLRSEILSLALLNSDFSLLVPELYGCSRTSEDPCGKPDCSCAVPCGGLLSPFDTHPDTINDRTPPQTSRVRPFAYMFGGKPGPAEPSLRLPMHTWAVEEMNLSILRDQYADAWHGLKECYLAITPIEGESSEARANRTALLNRHFFHNSDGDFCARAKQEAIRHGGDLPRNSALWGGLSPDGARFRVRLNAEDVESSAEKRLRVAEIIFGILRYLMVLPDSRAAGLADGIWQSLRVAYVEREPETRIDLPDTVCEELFTHQDVLEDSFSVLQLDKERTGSGAGFYQTWFVDRIMEHGVLWVGSYIPDLSGSQTKPETAGKEKAAGAQETSSEELQELSLTSPRGAASGKRPETDFSNTILGRQRRNQFQLDLVSFALMRQYGDNLSRRAGQMPHMTQSFLTTFIQQIGSIIKGDSDPVEAEKRRARRLAAAFDVDGPCIVATPYNPAWEMLPHPEVRSMSTCWVLEELPRSDDGAAAERRDMQQGETVEKVGGEAEEKEEQPLCTKVEDGAKKVDKGKGVKRRRASDSAGSGGEEVEEQEAQPLITEVEDGAKKVDKGKGVKRRRTSDSAGSGGEEGHSQMKHDDHWGIEPRLYKVVRKVKGLWQLMDMPLYRHSFV
ncbi:hypothetical protein RB597_009651 [Gaeumannomyces tritici]